jgi:hypothetical protein
MADVSYHQCSHALDLSLFGKYYSEVWKSDWNNTFVVVANSITANIQPCNALRRVKCCSVKVLEYKEKSCRCKSKVIQQNMIPVNYFLNCVCVFLVVVEDKKFKFLHNE